MSDLIKQIDAKTKLAGANKLEALTFSLGINPQTGREETFGINVFKVREVIKTPQLTAAPHMPSAVKGMVSLRGSLIPVVDLADYAGFGSEIEKTVLILTEYNGKTQGFLVHSVDTILRIGWSDMKVPPAMISGQLRGLVTSVTELKGGRLVMMLDVERVLSELSPTDEEDLAFQNIEPLGDAKRGLVFFCDDSTVARKQIQKTLEALGVSFKFAMNGKEAFDQLVQLAEGAASQGEKVEERVRLVLTDIEMPEMDGFALTKAIKADNRLKGLQVVMHSSLSGVQNQALGKTVGVDDYVSKFEPVRLAKMIRDRLSK
jgi:two-component system chemotaxis response regulator CheV